MSLRKINLAIKQGLTLRSATLLLRVLPCFFRPLVEKNKKKNQHPALTLLVPII